jgi:hypothetical protein
LPVELRWIFTGQIPNIVKHWFYDSTTLGNAKKAEYQEYDDIYLFTPEVDYLSVKFREEKLRIKWRKCRFPFRVNTVGFRHESKNRTITGTIEDWIVWEGEEKKATVNGIEEYMQKGKKHPWIKIIKERSVYKHKYKDGYLKQIADNEGNSDPDCSIELASLKLQANKKIAW